MRRSVRSRGAVAFSATLSLVLTACGGAGGDVDEALARLAVVTDVVDVRAGEVVVFRPGTIGEALGGGDDVRTGQPGYAEISFRDGSLARISPAAEFTVTDLAAEADAPQVELQLDVGRAWNRVRSSGGSYELHTDVGTAAVRGTAFDVNCTDPVGVGCIITVIEGSVAATGNAGGSADLVAVQRVTIAPDGTLGEVVDLTLTDARSDPWIASNLDTDARRGLPALADAAGPETSGVTTAAAGFAAVGVQSNEVGAARGDEVRQRLVAGGPSTINLTWSFCNPQICGTSENIHCTGGWNPTYRALQLVLVDPPAGYELVRASIATGSTGAATSPTGVLTTAGWQGGNGAFATPPSLTAAGGIQLALEAGGLESTYRRLPDFPDRPCAVSDERRDEILAQFGPTVVLDVAAVTIDVVWRRVAPPAAADAPPATQVVNVGGGAQEMAFTPAATPPPLVTDAPVFLQGDEEWARVLAEPTPSAPPGTETTGTPTGAASPTAPPTVVPSFAESGTVATTLANAFVRLGHDVDPAVIGERLLTVGAWRPGVGTSFTPFVNDAGLRFDQLLEGVPQEAMPTALLDVLDELAAGEAVALAGLATSTQRSLVLLTGYDVTTDLLTVLHPLRGEVTVTVTDLARQLTTLHAMTRTPEVVA